MTKVFIVGATGGTGSHLVTQLTAKGHESHALYRKHEQLQWLSDKGAIGHQGDLVSISKDELSAAMAGCDAVIFTAGANGGGDEMTDAIDGRGLELAAQSAAAAGISKFVLVSAFPDAWREKRMPPDFEHYMFIKRQSDVFLAHSDLDWIIVRPGTLTDESGTGLVRSGLAIPYGEIPREDVAAFICELIDKNSPHHRIIELTSGKDKIADSINMIP
ncbi:NAD(P)-binding oxidoreductase [Klebsiella pneumoniae]|nr:SDR family oxidoreductase [Klebsiella variicola]HDU5031716.1 SDR family oxidoreductase [Klebsiella variicola]